MAFYKGQETYSVDSKGRLNIPAKMRRALSPEALNTFVLTRGSDRCVAAYPLDEWRRYELEYAKLNQYDEQSRFFLRTVLAWSEEVELDGQQRIMVPKRYLDFAGIDGKVVIVGMIDHIELWQPEEFEIYLSKSEASYEQVASQVMQRPNGQ